MTLGLLPILAQTIAVGVGDRTELRYVIQPEDRSFQAETRASASVGLSGRNSGIALSYSPALYIAPLTIPVDNLTITQDAGLSGYVGFNFHRTSITLSQSVVYSQVNYALQALSAPTTPAEPAEPAPGGPPGGSGAEPAPQPAAEVPATETLKFLTATSSLSLSHELSRRNALSEYLSYTYHRALGEQTEAAYPTFHDLSANVTLAHEASRRDTLTSSATASHTWSETGARAWIASLSEGVSRRFSRNSSGSARVGVAYARGIAADGATEDGVFATLGLDYAQTSTWARGLLTLSLGASYSPAVDPATTSIDPRFNVSGGLSWWNRDRLTLTLSSNATLSTTPEDGGAVQSVSAALGLLYNLGAGFEFSTGVRTAWTTFEQVEILPPSVVTYVALSWYGNLDGTVSGRQGR